MQVLSEKTVIFECFFRVAPKNTSKTVIKHASSALHQSPAYGHVGLMVLHDMRKVLGH